MLFHEIYSTYFQTVAKILTEAVDHPLTSGEIDSIIRSHFPMSSRYSFRKIFLSLISIWMVIRMRMQDTSKTSV